MEKAKTDSDGALANVLEAVGNVAKKVKKVAKSAVKSASTAAARTTSTSHRATQAKTLIRAPSGSEFHLVDGRNVADLKELADLLDDTTPSVWNHHVTPDRNDFANWVRDVFQEVDLSKRIRESTSTHHAQVVIYRTILDRT